MITQFGYYPMREQDGEVILVTELNTRITYIDDRGHVQRFRTARAQARYDIHRALAPIRATIAHYRGINALLRSRPVQF